MEYYWEPITLLSSFNLLEITHIEVIHSYHIAFAKRYCISYTLLCKKLPPKLNSLK